MTNLITHIDKCLLKWIWFNTNRRYKRHCCLLLFVVTNNRVYNDAFRTFTFSMQQSLHDQKYQDNSFNFRFQIGNDRQSKRLLANLGRILLFHYYYYYYYFYKNRNTGFSSRLRLQKFCMNSRFRTGIFWIQWYRFDFAFILVI